MPVNAYHVWSPIVGWMTGLELHSILKSPLLRKPHCHFEVGLAPLKLELQHVDSSSYIYGCCY